MARVEDRIQDLSAKVTALIMLVENLYADSLAECNDPAGVGKILVEGVYKGERITEETSPGDEGAAAFGLQISEEFSALIDRAVSKAVRRRSKEGRGP